MKLVKTFASLAFALSVSQVQAFGSNLYDSFGSKTGSFKSDPFGSGVNSYDSFGRKTGSAKADPFGSGTNFYDSFGRKTGSAKKNAFGW